MLLAGAEDLLDTAPHFMDRAVDGFRFCRPVIFIARPHLGRDDSGSPAAVFHGVLETRPAIGAVGVNIARILRDDATAGLAIVDIGRRHLDPFDQGGVFISPSTRLSASSLHRQVRPRTAPSCRRAGNKMFH
jgi:hypothetical protein